ncbi:DUF3267 domain-containing protein [Radiobacillus kanasensis]|uniref:DUF3267 domain-containing protein n=1 Tax=Radiobacillus kanasensis TaxID=2844358 RepID=UPI001E3F39B9|nr:DUF3267 domain-containing protein [Radiobacillus kanasensis]UFU00484.1 DUF3267 domain-containing protein [Radiobacillus kanasensis]
MNCWKSINISKDFGNNRIYLISMIMGLLSFIILYLPLSIIHDSSNVRDYGLFPLLFGLLILPLAHKVTHLIPLLIMNKKIKVKWKNKKKNLPNFSFRTHGKMSKSTSLFVLLSPTVMITFPCIVGSYFIADFFAYFLLFAAINIAFSLEDFLYTAHLIKAPRKCMIENAQDGYDILIS